MPIQTTNLFLLEDLEDVGRTGALAEGDLRALHTVADWIKTFVARSHKDLGRDGPVCPFVPGASERRTLWLASEQIADRSVQDVVELVNGYKRLFLQAEPTDGANTDFKAILVVFTDVSVDRGKEYLDGVLDHLSVPSYVEDGLVLGEFYESNEGTAIYNANFRPFTAPAPFLLVRHAVLSDWKFFLDNDDWLNRWARHFGASAVHALAEELRLLPWRTRRAEPHGT